MPQVTRLRTLIARHFNITNDEADRIIGAGRVRVNGKSAPPAAKLELWEEVSVDGTIIRAGKPFVYIKFHKPRGIECTLNEAIADHLYTVFHHEERLYPVGRLDKDSEGLLIMTNDGDVFRNVAISEKEKEKEYIVTIDQPVSEEFLRIMAEGIVIMGQLTRPAKTFAVENDPNSFRIILTQGLNRQIRRMCYKLGCKVTRLIRTRIVNVELGTLEAGKWEPLSPEELRVLKSS